MVLLFSSSCLSACGGLARDYSGFFYGFASSLGVSNSLIVGFMGVMLAIEFTNENNLRNVWLESGSTMVVKAFSPPYCVSWLIRIKWIKCINLVSKWDVVVSHTFIERNSCADTLANLGLSLSDTSHFSFILMCIRADFIKNRLSLPLFFRFVQS